MQHATQLRILDELLEMLDTGTTCDAGAVVTNPVAVYTDRALAERERETFFTGHPQLVGLSGDLPQPGSYLALDELGLPLVAVRDTDGRFRAFVNACRHRGTRLVGDTRGTARRFVCPFHGWTYSADGRLVAIPEAAQFGEVDHACHGLVEHPALEQHGLLWVHPRAGATLDPDTLLGPLADEIAGWHVDDRVYRGGKRLDMAMNWKLANDTFGETYHFARLHRGTLGRIFLGDALACEAFGPHHRAVFPARSIARLRDKPRDAWRIDRVATVLYYLFPNVQITMSERQVTLFRIYPHADDPGRSTTLVSHYFSREALDQIAGGDKTVIDDSNVYDLSARDGNAIVAPAAAMEILDSTVEHEDFRMAELTQQSAASGALEHLVFGRNEAPLQHFHATFRAALGLPPLAAVPGVP